MMQPLNEMPVSAIVERLEPVWVLAKEDFLLIILPQKHGRPLAEYNAVLQSCLNGDREMAWTVLYANEFERFINGGHVFYSAFCRKECVLYSAGLSALPLTLWERSESIVEQAKRTFFSGHQRALAFLAGAEIFLVEDRTTLSLFMLHQATEQAMRSLILAIMGENIRTHKLEELRNHLRRCDFKLSSFLSAPDEQPLFTLLDNAYSASRYMDGFTCMTSDVEQLFIAVKTFLRGVENKFTETVPVYFKKSPL